VLQAHMKFIVASDNNKRSNPITVL